MNKASKHVSLQVLKFVFWHATYFLSVVFMGLKKLAHNSEIREFALDPQFMCAVLELET